MIFQCKECWNSVIWFICMMIFELKTWIQMDNPKVQRCYSTKFLLKNMDLVNWFVCADVCVKTHSAKIQWQTWKKIFQSHSQRTEYIILNCLNISWLDSDVREMPNEAWCKLNSQSQAAKHAAILATSYHMLAKKVDDQLYTCFHRCAHCWKCHMYPFVMLSLF